MSIVKRVLGSWYDVPYIRVPFEIIFVVLPIAFFIRTFGFGLYQVPTGSMETTLLTGERFFSDKLSYWFRKPVKGEIIAFDIPTYPYSSNPVVNLWQRYVSWNVPNWTKRVIGTPGDRIRGVVEDGKPVIYVNEKKLDESVYLNKYPLILLWKRNPKSSERNYDARSFDPSISYDQQYFYKIDPNLIIRDGQTGQPQPFLLPGTPMAHDNFDITLKENQYWVMGDNRLDSGDSRDFGILDGKLIHGKIIFRIWSMDSDESWWFVDLIKHPLSFWKKIRLSRCFQFVN